jgi:hypothetical protein
MYTNPIYIKINETIEFIKDSCVSCNIVYKTPQGDTKYITKKPQYIGIINGQKQFLPIHQELTDFLHTVPKGTRVRATRLTKGNARQTARYKIKVLREGSE